MRRRNTSQQVANNEATPIIENRPVMKTVGSPPNLAADDCLATLAWHLPAFSFLIMFVLQAYSAFYGVINDCDEVYNYWEPLHLFLYGEGFETWEYSPVYAIRSYFYIFLHSILPPTAIHFGLLSKINIYNSIRAGLFFLCFIGELYAFTAITEKISERAGRFFIFFSVFSSGVFLACSSFLPSSFCMTTTFFIIGAFLFEHWSFGIFCVAFSTLVSWPFSAVIGLPFVLQMLVLKDLKTEFILPAFFSGVSIGTVQFLVDTYYFGKPVVASLNIVLYNVLSGPGPSLYGEEPFSYYIKNLFLNWNIVIFVLVVGIPLTIWRMLKLRQTESLKESAEKNSATILFAATFLIWMLIFGAQAHKEERFLFPIYPFIAFLAAIVYDCLHEHLISRIIGNWSRIFTIFFVSSYVLLSFSRLYSIRANYGAHYAIYEDLGRELALHRSGVHTRYPNEVQVCVGKEWHRFPSSFYIPHEDIYGRRVRMEFVRSEFRGLLPKPYKTVLNLIDSTRHEPFRMNNMNQEEITRYVSLDSCDYFIDADMPATEWEPYLGEMPAWKRINSRPFIDLSKPAKYFGLLRAFYVPYFSAEENAMTTYSLYRNIAKYP